LPLPYSALAVPLHLPDTAQHLGTESNHRCVGVFHLEKLSSSHDASDEQEDSHFTYLHVRLAEEVAQRYMRLWFGRISGDFRDILTAVLRERERLESEDLLCEVSAGNSSLGSPTDPGANLPADFLRVQHTLRRLLSLLVEANPFVSLASV